ncbi:lantibiotic dehydratase family protein [Epilithonimonas sp.]|uniref:lantibiotic dehydratase family protein n=1 Tax=Epilithonimonas sp. TaxID=2894511 RepID=UPI00289BC67D|nr:lantibiotic dehydratase family protein [Epilithonimonas sp.]
MPRFPYQFFDDFIFRSPILQFDKFLTTFSQQNLTQENFLEICKNKIFQESIYLASPLIYEEIEQWLLTDTTLSLKLRNTILKYYSRMSTRCTPFGLFSGVGIGQFDKERQDELIDARDLTRDTKQDMYFLVALSQHLLTIPKIKERILFFPNNSIYKVGTNIRYVEYENIDGIREYIISSVRDTKELEDILNFSKKGKTIDEIKNILTNEEISEHEAKDFVEELIVNQLLISELDPIISGSDFQDSIISILNKIKAYEERDLLLSIKEKIQRLDSHIGNNISAYQEIIELIKLFSVDYEKKYLFQTDLYFKNEKQLSYSWKKTLKKGISFLNKITPYGSDTHFEKFKKAFYERFEDEEILLSFALDTELGIGYLSDERTKGIHPYLDDIILPESKKAKTLELKLNPIHIVLNSKIQDLILSGDVSSIKLTDNDFTDFKEVWEDLPATMSFITEIVSDNDTEKLFLNSGSGNAGRLSARFCSEKSNIKNFVLKIAGKEAEINSDQILAEIIHLPESRIGNILRRPTMRKFEIPYLAKSSLPTEFQIPMCDLYISIKNGRVILRSKKHNKEIIPCLTNAHNYPKNSLPVYHFLCDLNTQNKRPSLYFDWGGLKDIYSFLPRVEYENIILSKAQWKINHHEIKTLISFINDNSKLPIEIEIWRKRRKIPKWIQWVKSDNILVVNLKNLDMIHMFLDSVKNEDMIYVEELLYDQKNKFAHQFIFSIYNDR